MDPELSVTHWIDQLNAGERQAVYPLWERYFQKLVQLARHRLRHTPRIVANDEDIALSAFESFCRATEEGRFPNIVSVHLHWLTWLFGTEIGTVAPPQLFSPDSEPCALPTRLSL